MAHYIATIDHFRFERMGDELVVTSYRDDFEQRYDFPDDIDPRNSDVDSKLHERYYTDLLQIYEQ